MKIVIVGAGNVGYSIAQSLSAEGHDIVVIENREDLVERLTNELDVQVVYGNGSRPSVLEEAGVSVSTPVDFLIACSNKDEVNIMACWQAKHMGAKRVISRAKSLEYTESPEWANLLGIDEMISPERSVARDVEEMLWVNSAIHTTSFFAGQAGSYAFRVQGDSRILGKSLQQIGEEYPNFGAVFVYVERDGQGFIPSGDWVAREQDLCYLITFRSKSRQIEELFNGKIGGGGKNGKRIRKIMIVGGGQIGTFLVRRLLRNHPGADIKVIDTDKEACNQLSIEFPQISVLNGDGADDKLLAHEGVDAVDGFVAATGSDELNMVLAVLGKSMRAGKSIAIVRTRTYSRLENELPIDSIINPNESLASVILRYVRYPESAGSLSLIDRISSEILEVTVPENSKVIGRTLAKLPLPKKVIFAMIKRNGEVLLPRGDTSIAAQDVILVFAAQGQMAKTLKILGITT